MHSKLSDSRSVNTDARIYIQPQIGKNQIKHLIWTPANTFPHCLKVQPLHFLNDLPSLCTKQTSQGFKLAKNSCPSQKAKRSHDYFWSAEQKAGLSTEKNSVSLTDEEEIRIKGNFDTSIKKKKKKVLLHRLVNG